MLYHQENDKLRTKALEIRVTDHCNLRCDKCAHHSQYLPPYEFDINELKQNLDRLSKVLHSDRVTLIGGEPLLLPELNETINLVKESNIADMVCITTNGLLLNSLDIQFWELVDTVEISIYPCSFANIKKMLPMLYDSAWTGKTELRLIPVTEFKTVLLTEPIDDSEIIASVYNKCYYRYFCNTIIKGKFYKCEPSISIPALSEHLKHDAKKFGGFLDICSFDSPETLKKAVFDYLTDTTPLTACGYCLGTSGVSFPHKLLSKKEIKQPPHNAFNPDLIQKL